MAEREQNTIYNKPMWAFIDMEVKGGCDTKLEVVSKSEGQVELACKGPFVHAYRSLCSHMT